MSLTARVPLVAVTVAVFFVAPCVTVMVGKVDANVVIADTDKRTAERTRIPTIVFV